MDWNWCRLPDVRSAHLPGSRLVHWYASPSSQVFRLPLLTLSLTVAYTLGIYLLNLFLAFISPKFDPGLESAEDMEEGSSGDLPTKSTDEFKPFVRRLPEFKFWHTATRAVVLAFLCSWSEIFNLPVFWPVLVVYWLILVVLTMRRQIQHMLSKKMESTCNEMPELTKHNRVQIRAMGLWQEELRRHQEQQLISRNSRQYKKPQMSH